jgi:glutamine amidotransferase
VIALIDYGAGNLTSVKKALTSLGVDYVVPDRPEQCADAAALIVPGVGHFSATNALTAPWRDAITESVRVGKPLLGICVGMQWLFDGSDEAPDVPGLGLLEGRVQLLKGDAAQRLKVPHVGWNALQPPRAAGTTSEFRGRLLAGLAPGTHVYFTHSFAAPVTGDCVASSMHADCFSAVVERDNIFGVQFHPEKSSDPGLQILRNFLRVIA